MAQPSPETVWHANEKQLTKLLNSGVLVPKPKKINVYAPSFTSYKTSRICSSPNQFPTISVTGNACALHCKHCGGKVLETMLAADTPAKLYEVAVKLKQKGGLGCLVSGGCRPDGSVPLKSFIPTLARIKKELGLVVIVHTGIINLDTALALKNAEVDAALIDVVGSDETIRQVYNLNVTISDYEESLKAMNTSGLNFVPHVIVGLQNGRLNGEFQALSMISRFNPSAVVIIVFMPIPGTEMAAVKPPQPSEVARVIATARLMFPETPLALGCMRPKGKHRAETDVYALKAGVNGIAFPSEEGIKYAEEHGYELSFSPYCCSQVCVGKKGNFRSCSK